MYQEPIPVEQLVMQLCDVKQSYTQTGGYRPFGVSLLYMGHDQNFGFQLYQSDPSGNYGGWKATCIGSNNQAAKSILKQDYQDECNLHDGLLLAVKVFAKTMDSTTLTSDKRRCFTFVFGFGFVWVVPFFSMCVWFRGGK